MFRIAGGDGQNLLHRARELQRGKAINTAVCITAVVQMEAVKQAAGGEKLQDEKVNMSEPNRGHVYHGVVFTAGAASTAAALAPALVNPAMTWSDKDPNMEYHASIAEELRGSQVHHPLGLDFTDPFLGSLGSKELSGGSEATEAAIGGARGADESTISASGGESTISGDRPVDSSGWSKVGSGGGESGVGGGLGEGGQPAGELTGAASEAAAGMGDEGGKGGGPLSVGRGKGGKGGKGPPTGKPGVGHIGKRPLQYKHKVKVRSLFWEKLKQAESCGTGGSVWDWDSSAHEELRSRAADMGQLEGLFQDRAILSGTTPTMVSNNTWAHIWISQTRLSALCLMSGVVRRVCLSFFH